MDPPLLRFNHTPDGSLGEERSESSSYQSVRCVLGSPKAELTAHVKAACWAQHLQIVTRKACRSWQEQFHSGLICT